MRHFWFVTRRYILTFFCKFFVEVATLTKWKWTVPTLDFFIKKRGLVLAKDAKECMYKTKVWQKKAERCIAAYHEFEKYMKDGEKK